jgi:alkylation response protein AidB-like acyl-CoA dehydrogenase
MDLELTETQRLIKDTIRTYLQREIEPLVADMEAERLLPYEPVRTMLHDLGFDGGSGGISALIADARPEDHLDLFIMPTVAIEMSRVCAGMTLSYGASIGLAGGNIRARGTPDQIRRWAEPLLRFDKIGSWALTEPQAGSAALRDMQTTAVRDGDQFVLNGSKTFITNAPYADVFVVYAKLRDGTEQSVQAFILERGDPGLSTGKPFKKMGFRSSPTGEVFLTDCCVPAERLLGGGIKQRDHVRESLANERSGLQLISYGIMERAFDIAVAYARERRQGGQPIGEYQLVQRRLARMYMCLANAHAFVFGDLIAGRRRKPSVADVCVGKLYVAEMATQVTMDAIHILAGNGYMEEYVVERLARDAKLVELGGGTTEIQELTAGRWIVDHYGR